MGERRPEHDGEDRSGKNGDASKPWSDGGVGASCYGDVKQFFFQSYPDDRRDDKVGQRKSCYKADYNVVVVHGHWFWTLSGVGPTVFWFVGRTKYFRTKSYLTYSLKYAKVGIHFIGENYSNT
jgi:hypothetical protein